MAGFGARDRLSNPTHRVLRSTLRFLSDHPQQSGRQDRTLSDPNRRRDFWMKTVIGLPRTIIIHSCPDLELRRCCSTTVTNDIPPSSPTWDTSSKPFHSKAAVCRLHANNAAARESLGTETPRMFLGRVRRIRLITPAMKKEFMVD